MDVALALLAAFLFALGLVIQEKAAATLPAEAVGKGFWFAWRTSRSGSSASAPRASASSRRPSRSGSAAWSSCSRSSSPASSSRCRSAACSRGDASRREELVGAVLVTAGLGALLVVSKPAEGTDDASLLSWAVIGGAPVGLAIVLFALARGRMPALRAGLLGTAAGILFGLSAALTKTAVSRLDEGLGAVFGDWHVYALVLVSIAAFWLEQAALQTGALAAAVATTMAFDPLSSLVFGIVLFDQALHERRRLRVLGARALRRPGRARSPRARQAGGGSSTAAEREPRAGSVGRTTEQSGGPACWVG